MNEETENIAESIILLLAVFGVPFFVNSRGLLHRVWALFTVFLITGLAYSYRIDKLYRRNTAILAFQTLGLRRDFDSYEFKKVKKGIYFTYHPDRSPEADKAQATETFQRLDQILKNLSPPRQKGVDR
jgi:hypothetical protein